MNQDFIFTWRWYRLIRTAIKVTRGYLFLNAPGLEKSERTWKWKLFCSLWQSLLEKSERTWKWKLFCSLWQSLLMLDKNYMLLKRLQYICTFRWICELHSKLSTWIIIIKHLGVLHRIHIVSITKINILLPFKVTSIWRHFVAIYRVC